MKINVAKERVKFKAHRALAKPMLRRELRELLVEDLLRPYDIPQEVKEELKQIENLGWHLQELKTAGLISNDSNCVDANEGMVAPAGTYFQLVRC